MSDVSASGSMEKDREPLHCEKVLNVRTGAIKELEKGIMLREFNMHVPMLYLWHRVF